MTAPRWTTEFGDLAAVAGDLLAQRTLRYPDAVARSVLSAEQAAQGLRVMTAIAADWRRHVDLVLHRLPAAVGPPPPPATRDERILTLTQAAERAAKLVAAAPDDAARADYAELVTTLLWWERQPFGIRFITDVNLELRARDATRLSQAA